MQQDENYDMRNSFGKILGMAHTALLKHLSKNLKDQNIPLTPEQFRVLMHLWHEEGKSQQELAMLSCRDRANVTRIIDILEREGIVSRQDDLNDRRIFKIHLTALGKALEQPTTECAKNTLADALKGIATEEIEICKKVLQQVAQNLG